MRFEIPEKCLAIGPRRMFAFISIFQIENVQVFSLPRIFHHSHRMRLVHIRISKPVHIQHVNVFAAILSSRRFENEPLRVDA